jgi:hypothetical protein
MAKEGKVQNLGAVGAISSTPLVPSPSTIVLVLITYLLWKRLTSEWKTGARDRICWAETII